MQHHAYYIEGTLSAFDAYKAQVRPYYARVYERFGIDEARELTTLASLKNYQEAVFLLALATMTSEAQQALLKLFEEPQEGTRFIVLVPYGVLLPTLKSRMMVYPQLLETDADSMGATKFLKLAGKDRSDFITKLLKDDEGTKERVRDFINALEIEIAKKVGDPKARAALADIAMVRDYVRDRSPSLKMLLEHLAIALPSL